MLVYESAVTTTMQLPNVEIRRWRTSFVACAVAHGEHHGAGVGVGRNGFAEGTCRGN
jgi:hypothetical protein